MTTREEFEQVVRKELAGLSVVHINGQAIGDSILAAYDRAEGEIRREVGARIRLHASAGPANTIDKARVLDAVDEALGEGLYHKPTISPTGRMATAKELEQASKRLSRQIDKNIEVFKRLADK